MDLLDGVKLKELYFKGSYLVNFKNNEKSTRSWMYLTFGKNRFFSTRDSLSRMHFNYAILKPSSGDSVPVVHGFYSSSIETVTDNIFASLDYLYNIRELSLEKSKIFINGGFYFGLQTLKTNYNIYDIISDTTNYFMKPDTTYTFDILPIDIIIRQFNYNISLGFTHILSTEKINIKTHITTGLNIFNYPYYMHLNSINDYALYTRSCKTFIQLRMDATVLNPGLSIGFETFIRPGEIPLFNVSLTKVLNIEQLSSLFGNLTPTNNK